MVAPPTDSASTPQRADERLAETVGQLTRGWIRWVKEEARELGLSPPQLFLLGGLHDHGQVPVTRWAEAMGASPSATTGLLDGLEQEGYIVRSHDPDDRRQVLVSLTPKGTRLAVRLRAKFRGRWKILCAGIPSAQLDAANRTLGEILARIREEDFPHAPKRATRPTQKAVR